MMTTIRRVRWTTLAGLLWMLSPAVAWAQEPAPKAPSAEEAPSLKDVRARSSYAVGMNLGSALRRQSPDLDVKLIVQGFQDALSGEKTLLSPVEMRTLLNRLQAEVKTRQAALQSEGAAQSRSEGEPALARIDLAFKVDPRITRGLYMGDRWVPLPYTQIGEGRQVTVEARAEGVDEKGKPVSISPRWTPGDPAMVTVTPDRGKEVRITALGPGESSLQVISEGISRQLAVKAAHNGAVLQVQISEKP